MKYQDKPWQDRVGDAIRVVAQTRLTALGKSQISEAGIAELNRSVQKPPGNAEPSSWIVARRCTVSLAPAGAYHFPVGKVIDDPCLANDLIRSGAELIPQYAKLQETQVVRS